MGEIGGSSSSSNTNNNNTNSPSKLEDAAAAAGLPARNKRRNSAIDFLSADMVFEPLFVPMPSSPELEQGEKTKSKQKADDELLLTIEPCERCKELIDPAQEKPITSDNGLLRWHPACFTCKECDEDLYVHGFFIHDAEIYCDQCMDICFGDLCDTCHKPILEYSKDQEKYISRDGTKHYHGHCVAMKKVGNEESNNAKGKGRRKSTTIDCLYC